MIRSAELTSLDDEFKISRKGRNGSSTGILIYPDNMQDDAKDEEAGRGQDRIEFALHEYNARTESNGFVRNPSSLGNLQNPFKELKERVNENSNYKPVSKFYLNDNQTSYNKVILPIQDKISDTNAVEWEGSTLNELQRRLANLAYNLMKDEGQGIDVSGQALYSLLKDGGLGTLGRLYFVQEAVGVQNLMSRASGKVINPNMELLFKGPTLRPFTFNFKLSPRDKNESEMVKLIIKFFKKAMAPRIEEGTLFLKAPYVFGIKYLMGSKTLHPGLNLIKKCALTGCNVDYTPNNSYMTYKDGTMISYSINLTFQELVPVYDLDYFDAEPTRATTTNQINNAPEINNHSIGY